MNHSELPNSSDDTWEENPDWIGCANGCGWGATKDRGLCRVCLAHERRDAREAGSEEPMGQMWLPLKETGT